jgi:signal transduction histidine kinase
MLGRTKPELGFWVAPDQRDGLLHQLLARGQVRDFEVTFRTKSGEERQLLTNSEVITYEGEPAVLSVSVDITERKQLEAQQEARRQEAEILTRTKDEFLATLSHELRNPLGAIPTRSACWTGLRPETICATWSGSSTARPRASPGSSTTCSTSRG